MPNTKWLRGAIVALIILVFTKTGTSCASSETIRTTIAGWHLVVPPFVPGDPPGPLQLRAPLSHWFETDWSETAVDCAEQRDNMTRMYRSADITSTAIQFELLLYHYAVCVSSADPRLAPSQRASAQRFARLPEANRVATGYAGPPIQRGSDRSADYHSGQAFEADQSDMQIAVPMILLTLMLTTTAGSVGGWLLEPGRGRRDTQVEPQQPATRLQARGVPMVEFFQTTGNLTEASSTLYNLIKERGIAFYSDDGIRLAISRAVAIETGRGWHIGKTKQSHKIDVVIALAQAALGAVQGGQTIGHAEKWITFGKLQLARDWHAEGLSLEAAAERAGLPVETLRESIERAPVVLRYE